ncbi:MAG TPA: POTRA domain-containing protein [Vicinamibacterales bacterium]|nr:POTRA domain-containing protein [Vicinamibacterales bacterium]
MHSDVSAQAQVGQTVVEIRFEQEGEIVSDPVITRLAETRAGEPLAIRAVRETITHLMSLSRFEDVQVFSEPVPGGVRVKYVLVPTHPVDRVEFVGKAGLSTDDLRRVVTDRFGRAPSAARADEVADALRAEYRRRGYPAARVTPRVDVTHKPDRATLVLEVDAGVRARILGVKLTQIDAEGQSNITDRPDIREGEAYDEQAIVRALQAWENRMRRRDFYEARASHAAQIADDGVFVTVSLTRGPRVVVMFVGDPLPESERDRLVPVRSEASVDEDLLEDASRAIESYLYARGYRDADAPYTREEGKGELVITFRITRGPRYVLRDITTKGNVAIPTPDLLRLVRLEEGQPFVRDALSSGVAAITGIYRARGFTRADVKPVESVLPADDPADPDRQVSLTVAVVEGPRTLVRTVTFQGNMALTVSDLRSATTLAPGRPYSTADVITDRDLIEQTYRDRGYDSVVVTPAPTFVENDTRADIAFTINEGPQIIVDHIIITGNRRISTETIERELVVKPGDPLGDAAMVQSRSNLVALELFRRIQIEAPSHGGETRRDVVVQVEESPATTIDGGGGVEGGYFLRPTGPGGAAEERFEVAPRGSFGIGRRNLWGKNRSVNLSTRVSLRSRDTLPSDVFVPTPEQPIQSTRGFHEYRVVGTYREPKALGTPADVLLTGIIEQGIRPSFNFSRREARAQAAMRVSPLYSVSGLYSIQKTKLFDERASEEDKPLIDRLFPQVRISKFSGTLIRDSRDAAEALDPSHGTQVIVTGDLAPRALGSEVGFIKTYLQGFVYRRLPGSRRIVLALGARVGMAHDFAREVDVDGELVQVRVGLPASERFFAGGDTSVRGFSLDRLGNADTITATGFPTGGNGVVVLNSELRVNVVGPFQATGFVDAGNVFKQASDLSFTDLRPAAGFGVLYRSPIGPIRVDLGFNLNRRELVPGTPEKRPVYHILLGQAF